MKFVKSTLSVWTVLSLFVVNTVFAQNAYIQTDIIKVAGVTDPSQISRLPAANIRTSYTYLNGLGTPTQKVGYEASPYSNDVIQIYQYDQFGQQAINYLPYVDDNTQNTKGSYRATALTDQQNYYISNSAPGNSNKVANDPLPFSQELFENSPLRRLLAVGSTGLGFQPDFQDNTQHFTAVSYHNNSLADNVMISPINGGTTFYPANTLSVTDMKDADAVETLVFKNSAGQTILKRQVSGNSTEPYYDTYYVFNANGSVAYVIPPKAAHLIALGTATNISVAPLCNLIYAYTYDALGRIITRKAPNTGVVSMIYDPMNRPILIQDGRQAASNVNQWYYIKYDSRSRPISQGIYTDNTNIGQANMQNYVNSNYGVNSYESRSSSQATGYYTNNCFPSQNLQPLGYSFYDDYNLTQTSPSSSYYTYQLQGLVDGNGNSIEAAPVALTQGMLTMVLKRSVGNGLSTTWLSKVYFYDKHNNVIQVQSNNQLNFMPYAVTDYRTLAPDFTGKPLQAKVTKVTGSGAANTNSVLTSIIYDNNNERVQSISQAYNSQAPITIANYSYNEIGQVVTKILGQITTANVPATLSLNSTYVGTNTAIATSSITMTDGFSVPAGSTFNTDISTGYLQTLDYRYNIRDQLLSINNSTLSWDGGVTNNDNTDLFGMTYLYDGTDPNLVNATPSYTGRISAVKWSYKYNNGGSISNERSYVYKYDQLGQLNKALYAERAPGSSSTTPFNVNTGGFDETGITYDDDGNITALQRNYSSNAGTGGTPLDNLTYTYNNTNNPDQLYQVSDAVAQTGTYGFNNVAGATASNYYQYDVNGNLTADPYKGIGITYNLINKTDVITAQNISNSTINYTYGDANTLLRKQIFKNGSLQTTTDYIDEFVYINGTVSYFSMPEGRVVNASGTLKPEYIIADQQGNARFSFQDNGSGAPLIIQENSYYGFGSVMPNSLVAPSPNTNNNNLYNGGSEWQNAFQNLPDYYQTGSRNYDPELGRFISVDPIAELSASLTSYHYAGNNPIMRNDPTGNCMPDDPGCTILFPYADGGLTDPQDTGTSVPTSNDTGGGGGGDPSVDYSGNGVPSTSSSYGGAYNNNGGLQLGSTGVNFTLTLQGNWTATYNGLSSNTYDKQVVENSWTSENGNFSYERIGYSGFSDAQVANYQAETNAADARGSSDAPGSSDGASKEGPDYFDLGNKGNALFGVGVTSTDLARIAGNVRIGEKTITELGVAGGIAGTALDGVGVYNYYHPTKENINSRVSPFKFGMDGSVTSVGIWGGPGGEIGASWYFAIDAFYPGGVPGWGKDMVSEPIDGVVLTGSL